MPTLELPEDVYEALAQRAEIDHRTVDEQAAAELTRIQTEREAARRRRHEAIEWLRKAGPAFEGPGLDPVAIVREDRDR